MVVWQGITEGGTAVPVQITEEGKVVAIGEAGPKGDTGPEGPPGPEGQPGKDGKDGDQWNEVNSRLIMPTKNVGTSVLLDSSFGGNLDVGGSFTASGLIESKSEGFKFPDGTIQTTAGGGETGTAAWGSCGGNGSILLASSNIREVERTGTGSYTVWFSNPMPSNKYSVQLTMPNVGYGGRTNSEITKFVDRFQWYCSAPGGAYFDTSFDFTVNAGGEYLPTIFTEAQMQKILDFVDGAGTSDSVPED